MKEFVITDAQKKKLNEILEPEEYNRLIELEWEYFFGELDDCIVMRLDENYATTPEANELQRLFDQIFNQN